jgi:cytosine/adenosine deaminase-related metal-dependent hydrolase
MKKRILLHGAQCLATMDDARTEHENGWVLVQGAQIIAVGSGASLPAADEYWNLSGHVVMPGMVNTHHHMYQSLTRAVPAAQDASLFGWLKVLYPIWAGLTPEMLRVSTRTAIAELMFSGCTTSSDHLYLFPNGCRLDDEIEAATGMGMRFHACRGAMSVGESQGGLPPDGLVEDERAVMRDTLRLIETYHDPAPFSMLTVGGAPCSPFSVSQGLMRDMAALARATGTRLHTHLAENQHDVEYCRARFNRTPAEYAEDAGWLGADVWHAHCVKLDAPGVARFGQTGTGVAHCPCSNMRLASGIAPVRQMVRHGVPVGLGVDGCASNDGAHILAEARQAMLVARLLSAQGAPEGKRPLSDHAMASARDMLALATRGGAKVLGRDDIGQIAPGKAADIVAFDLRGLGYAGAQMDPLASLVFCAPSTVAFSMINGRVRVQDGQLCDMDMLALVVRHNQLSVALCQGG